MKSIMKKLGNGFTVMILTLFGILALSQEALAKPNWVANPYSYKIIKVGKDKNKPGYYAIKFSIGHKNNSKQGKIITSIFDKTLKVYFTIDHLGRLGDKCNFSIIQKASKVNKVEIYPGQSTNLTYTVPLKFEPNRGNGCSKDYHYNLFNSHLSYKIEKKDFKSLNLRINYDYQVRFE